MQLLTLGLAKLVGISLAASCLHSPAAWSPDRQWLAYTLQDAEPADVRQPGWLADPARWLCAPSPGAAEVPPALSAPAGRFKLWVTHRNLSESVLLEESPGPLSAPGWSADGRQLAYLRFLPEVAGSFPGRVRGRCELVVQDGLDRKRVVLSLPRVVLRRDQLEEFPAIQPSWSPDGQSLMVNRPGAEPAILIVEPGTQRVLKTLAGVLHASWSPEGARVAVVVGPADGHVEQRLQILGPDPDSPRTLPGAYSEIHGPPIWSADGQTILIAARRPQLRNRGIELIRIQADSGISSPLLPFVSLPVLSQVDSVDRVHAGSRAASSPRVWMSLDRERELCAFAADLPGQDSVIGFCSVRVPQTFKRFPPIDASFRIGSISMDPGGQTIAVRVEGAGKTGPAFLCELGSEDVSLLTPDPQARSAWIATLMEGAVGLLRTALPAVSVDGVPVERMTVLPLGGEIPRQSTFSPRLGRIGRIGRALLRRDGSESEREARVSPPGLDDAEARLLFDALAGAFDAAESDLDELTSSAATPEMRLRWLALRAQILHAAGHVDRARAVVEYLLDSQQRASHRIEETPAGIVLSPLEDPLRGWLVYLQRRVDQAEPPRESGARDSEEAEEIDLRLPARIGAPRRMGPGVGPAPLTPRLGPPPPAPRIRGAENGRGDLRLRSGIQGELTPLPPRPFQPVTPPRP